MKDYTMAILKKAHGDNFDETKAQKMLDDLMKKFRLETDNRELGKKMGNALNNLKQEITVKLPELPDGMYLLRIDADSGTYQQKLLIR